MWKVIFSGQCVCRMLKLRSRWETEQTAPSRTFGHTVLCLFHLDCSKKRRVGRGLQSSSPLGHAVMSQHMFDHNRYVRRSREDISNLRPYKGRTKVSKKETCCLCPFLLNTYYIALLLCWAVSLERVEGHPPSSHRILFIWS